MLRSIKFGVWAVIGFRSVNPFFFSNFLIASLFLLASTLYCFVRASDFDNGVLEQFAFLGPHSLRFGDCALLFIWRILKRLTYLYYIPCIIMNQWALKRNNSQHFF